MLKKRLIPKLQLKTRNYGNKSRLVLVTTHQFRDAIDVGDPVSQAKIYQAQMADELILLDLDAASGLRKEFIDIVRKTAEQIFMPITVGGGVRTIEDIKKLLVNGADKVCLNTATFEDSALISLAAKMFGSQCIVVSIDYRKNSDGLHKVWKSGGKVETEWTLDKWVKEAEKLGAGEVLLTSIEKDGTCKGMDVDLIASITNDLSIPVVISGGCGLASHFIDGFNKAGVSGVAAGTFFCFKDQNPMQTRAHISNAGISIRMLN